MLVFEHNAHQVNECDKLAQELGFSLFQAKHTSRFKDGEKTVLNKDGTTSHILHPSIHSKALSEKLIKYNPLENTQINCKAIKEQSIYVNAQGEVTACCWLDFRAVPPFNPGYVDFKDKGFSNPTLRTTSLEQIFSSAYFKKIEDQWASSPLLQCSKQCGKIDKFKEQFNV